MSTGVTKSRTYAYLVDANNAEANARNRVDVRPMDDAWPSFIVSFASSSWRP